MSHAILTELVRASLTDILNEGKSARLSGQNQSDLAYALNWLRLNKVLKNAGSIITDDSGRHHVTIKFKGDKNALINKVKSRFGAFVKVT